MTDTKFTPGPWTQSCNNVYAMNQHVFREIHIADCDVHCSFSAAHIPLKDHTIKANANLIATAPELYENLLLATGHIKEIYDMQGISRPESIIKRAEQTLAKARGEQ